MKEAIEKAKEEYIKTGKVPPTVGGIPSKYLSIGFWVNLEAQRSKKND